MAVTGPDFLALQVRDLDRSATFYESRLGLRRLPASSTRRSGLRYQAGTICGPRAVAGD